MKLSHRKRTIQPGAHETVSPPLPAGIIELNRLFGLELRVDRKGRAIPLPTKTFSAIMGAWAFSTRMLPAQGQRGIKRRRHKLRNRRHQAKLRQTSLKSLWGSQPWLP